MSTVAHPRSVPSGPSRKIVAGFLVGAALAVALGYGVVTLGDPASGELSQPAGSDQVIAQKAAEIAAAKAAAVARGEHMQEINEIGFGNATLSGAELAARTEWMLEINELGYGDEEAADLATTEDAQRRGERMFEINSFGWEPPKLENAGPKSPLVAE